MRIDLMQDLLHCLRPIGCIRRVRRERLRSLVLTCLAGLSVLDPARAAALACDAATGPDAPTVVLHDPLGPILPHHDPDLLAMFEAEAARQFADGSWEARRKADEARARRAAEEPLYAMHLPRAQIVSAQSFRLPVQTNPEAYAAVKPLLAGFARTYVFLDASRPEEVKFLVRLLTGALPPEEERVWMPWEADANPAAARIPPVVARIIPVILAGPAEAVRQAFRALDAEVERPVRGGHIARDGRTARSVRDAADAVGPLSPQPERLLPPLKFDQSGFLTRTFGVTTLPSLVRLTADGGLRVSAPIDAEGRTVRGIASVPSDRPQAFDTNRTNNQ